jgi:hypothetical protein
MAKMGDVREDGMVFWSKNAKGYEYWRTPEDFARAFEKMRERSKAKSVQAMERYRTDPEFREAWTAKNRQYHREDYRRRMFYMAKGRAAKLGVPFNLETLEDIAYVTHCPVLGVELVIGAGLHHDFSPSLDRVVQELGYVKGNVIVVSFLANKIKSNATPEQIMAVAKFYKKLERNRA